MCDSQASFAPAIGPSWSGLSGLRHIVIFGDSYSAVGYKGSLSPHPTVNEPLGEPFPGFCYTEAKRSGKFGSTLPNWVGHFISSRKSKEQTLLVYDYAVGGHTVSGVRGQVERQFLPHVGQKPEWARWNAEDTLFVTWVGINDCAINWANREGAIDELVGLQELLYTQAGARNFLLVDVPPIHLSPAGKPDLSLYLISSVPEPQPSAGKHYLEWNAALRSRAKNFQSAHPDCTTLIFSAHETFTRLCTDPEAFGFQKTDVKQPSGAMWVDYLHPTSAVHKVVANDIEIFLEGLTPAEGGNKVDELVRK
ncbi:hypothetical protein DFH11DRAFT_1505240 [Phellopilus nigrolimitatus]|nr:hypothetical protein DFH11DRAFT_1505240 [Phellopilus nigrolimitatus]